MSDPAMEPRRAKLTSYSDIERERVEWLWDERIPLKAVTLLAGVPGLGKSQFAIWLAAQLTRGKLACGRAKAIIATGEDPRSTVIRPRLEAAQADLTAVTDIRISIGPYEDGLILPRDLSELEACVVEEQAKLVVIDPLVAFLDSGIDSWRDSSVRQALAPLALLAENQDCTVLGIVHLNKGNSSDGFQRIGGSVGFQGAPRSVLIMGRDPDDEGQRVLVHHKSNFGQEAASLLLGVEDILLPETATAPQTKTSRIAIIGECEHTAESILGRPPSDDEGGASGAAEDFLLTILGEGPVEANVVEGRADDAGISRSTLRRAKKNLGVTMANGCVHRVGGAAGEGHWVWELPNVATTKETTPISPDGHLSSTPHEESEFVPNESLRGSASEIGPLSEGQQGQEGQAEAISRKEEDVPDEPEPEERPLPPGLGDPMYPVLLAEAVKNRHITHREAEERYALHKLVAGEEQSAA